MTLRPPFDVGEALVSTTKLGFAAVPVVLPLAVLTTLPAWLLQPPGSVESTRRWVDTLAVVPALVNWLLTSALLAVVLPPIFRLLARAGRDAAPEVPRFGRRLLLVALVSLPSLAISLGGSLARERIRDVGLLASLALVCVGLLFFWIGFRLLVAPAVAVAEGSSFSATVARTWDLTRGRVIVLFFSYVGLVVPVALAGAGLGAVLRAAGAEKGMNWGFAAVDVLATPFHLALLVVVYEQLRRGPGGAPAQTLTRAAG